MTLKVWSREGWASIEILKCFVTRHIDSLNSPFQHGPQFLVESLNWDSIRLILLLGYQQEHTGTLLGSRNENSIQDISNMHLMWGASWFLQFLQMWTTCLTKSKSLCEILLGQAEWSSYMLSPAKLLWKFGNFVGLDVGRFLSSKLNFIFVFSGIALWRLLHFTMIIVSELAVAFFRSTWFID